MFTLPAWGQTGCCCWIVAPCEDNPHHTSQLRTTTWRDVLKTTSITGRNNWYDVIQLKSLVLICYLSTDLIFCVDSDFEFFPQIVGSSIYVTWFLDQSFWYAFQRNSALVIEEPWTGLSKIIRFCLLHVCLQETLGILFVPPNICISYYIPTFSKVNNDLRLSKMFLILKNVLCFSKMVFIFQIILRFWYQF